MLRVLCSRMDHEKARLEGAEQNAVQVAPDGHLCCGDAVGLVCRKTDPVGTSLLLMLLYYFARFSST